MIIHQAAFGPLRGHSFLRGSSDLFEELFRNAAWATDLPQTAPIGVTWAEFLRLVRLDEHLLLIHTRPLVSASRAGMVLSRAAFIPLVMVEQLNDIRPVAQALRAAWTVGDAVSPIHLRASPAAAQVEEPTALAMQIAAALSRCNKRPLVIFGQEGFDDAMLDLWMRVPAEFRSLLTFGLSFGQEDVHDLSVVCTPVELSGRWDPSLHVGRTEQGAACLRTATLLNLPIGAPVRSLADELQFSLNSPAAIAIGLKAYQLWNAEIAPADAVNLLRILVERAGSGPTATAIKSAVVDKLASSVADWTGQEVLSIRNLEVTAIPGADRLSEVLTSWVGSLPSRAAPSDIRNIMQSWAMEKPTPLWLSAIGAGLESACATKDVADYLIAEIWHAMAKLPERAGRLLSLLVSGNRSQKRFFELVPRTIEITLADSLLSRFVSRGWWEVAGILLARSRSATDALTAALALNSKSAKRALLASALSNASDEEIVAAAVLSQDVVAIQIAADACVRTPDLIKGFDWKSEVWFQLLGEAASKSESIIKALPNVSSGIGQTIDAQLADKSVWRVVATTALADLIDVPGRERAWLLIPKEYAEAVSAATARSWLLRFEEARAAPRELEPQLAAAVHAIVSARGYLVEVLRQAPAALPLYVREFSFSSQHEARSFLADLEKSEYALSESAAQAIGDVFKVNNWEQAALEAARSLRYRSDYRPMVKECLSLLGLIDRLWVSWQLGLPMDLTPDEGWAAFESEAASLYPRGPEDRELWSRSGGQNEDLASEDTGRARWHRCIRGLRSGKAPCVQALLNVMLEEFPYNDTLQQLSRASFWR